MSNPISLTSLRNIHFFHACRRVITNSSTPLTLSEIICRALRSKPQGYYVSFSRAYTHVLAIELGHERAVPGSLWALLHRKAKKIASRNSATSLATALNLVLADGNAPRFFITPSTARRIYQRTHNALRTSLKESLK